MEKKTSKVWFKVLLLFRTKVILKPSLLMVVIP